MKTSVCKECEYCKRYYLYGGSHEWFYGCTYGNYNGRYIKQIEECPKEKGGVEE